MRCRLKPLEYECHQLEEPVFDGPEVVGAVGDWEIVMPSGARLVCPQQEFELHYDLIATTLEGGDGDKREVSDGNRIEVQQGRANHKEG